MEPKLRILLVDGDPETPEKLRSALSREFEIETAASREDLKACLAGQIYDLSVIDPWLLVNGELQFQPWMFDEKLPNPVVVLTSIREPENKASLKKEGSKRQFIKSWDDYSRLVQICEGILLKKTIIVRCLPRMDSLKMAYW